jgi:GNAT superfamily N-acetyltransferase
MRRLLALAILTAMLTTAAELNHFYRVIDHETYSAIEGCDFLKSEFAAFEKRTTVRTDGTYTAIYFYGTHTYFELFDAPGEKRNPGESGIAFGVDSTAAEPKVVSSEKHLTTREWQGVQIPWFYTLSGQGGQGLGTWLMEYHQDFLAKWHPDAGDPAGGITREAVLRRYKAVLRQTPTDSMLDDVAGLTVAASPEERQPIEQWIRDISSGFPVQFVEPGARERGIREVRFRLRRAPAKIVEARFGAKSVLRLRPDGTALWTF